MIILDVNVLLYAYDKSSIHHDRCRQWLEVTLNSSQSVGLPWQTLLGFIRISTSPRAVGNPLSTAAACEIVGSWLARSTVVIPEPGERFWDIFLDVVDDAKASGPLITDAALAALALENGATLCSTDRDFRRFERLNLFDPSRA